MTRKRFDSAPQINVKDEGLLIQQVAGSTANLLDVKKSDNTSFVSVDSSGNVALPSTTSIGNVSSTELGYLDGVTSAVQTQLNGKLSTGVNSASPTFNALTLSSATPSLQLRETATNSNVDIFLGQSGTEVEGLRMRYESGTGDSRLTNIYSTGSLYFHTKDSTSTGFRIDPTGNLRFSGVAPRGAYYATTTAYVGSTYVIGRGVDNGLNVTGANTWVNWGDPMGLFIPEGTYNIIITASLSLYTSAAGAFSIRVRSVNTSNVVSTGLDYNCYTNISGNHRFLSYQSNINVQAYAGDPAGAAFSMQVYGNGLTVSGDNNDHCHMTAWAS